MRTRANIWSEGVRLAGSLFKPDDLKDNELRPTLLLCHGWGGAREHLDTTYAPWFCAAGFIVMTFDYRGWFDSDARLVSTLEQPKPYTSQPLTIESRAIRDVVDPFDQVMDITACLDFLLGEEGVDKDRIGIWGSSYGGGHAVTLAATDPRIKCMVSQVGAVGTLTTDAASGESAQLQQRATAKARGVNPIIPPGGEAHESLVGHPDWAKMYRYNPIRLADKITAPSLFIDQASEELFDQAEQYPRVLEVMNDAVPVSHHTFEGTHYDVYEKNFKESAWMATDWFTEHLKP